MSRFLSIFIVTSLVSIPACNSERQEANQSNKPANINELETSVTKFSLAQGRTQKRWKRWRDIQEQRQDEYNEYMADHASGKEAFLNTPIAFNGVPAILFQLFPYVMPDLANDTTFNLFTGLSRLDDDDILPRGMSLTAPPQGPSIQNVQFTCGTCHTGEITKGNGDTEILIGAPSVNFDINGYRSFLGSIVTHPAYTYENFKQALIQSPIGSLYGTQPENIAKEMFDRAVFLGTENIPAQGQALVGGFKHKVLTKGQVVQSTLGMFSYQGDMTLLHSSPGHVEAFGFATLAFVPREELILDPYTALPKYFSPFPSVADIMSVWQQSERSEAQWDGNIRSKLHRNLGAELGVAGDPRAVNFQNGIDTTAFVENLPAPVYPFDVHMGKAAAGKLIYKFACASCHETEKFMGVDEAGTEPGRARGLTPAARELLVQNLKAICTDGSVEDCNAADEDIIVPRQENPGYLALPLTGIWARAPYLHNGSVPTMYHLLVPESRPDMFYTGYTSYDEDNMGFSWTEGRYLYNTSQLGLSNVGHDDIEVFHNGIDFGKHHFFREALIEYLKTL